VVGAVLLIFNDQIRFGLTCLSFMHGQHSLPVTNDKPEGQRCHTFDKKKIDAKSGRCGQEVRLLRICFCLSNGIEIGWGCQLWRKCVVELATRRDCREAVGFWQFADLFSWS
jgi:hypothetical protein